MKTKNIGLGEMIVPLITLFFSVYYLFDILGQRFEVMLFGGMFSVVVMIFSLLALIQLKGQKKNGNEKISTNNNGQGILDIIYENYKIFSVPLGLLFFILMLYLFGFIIGVSVYLFLMMVILGVKRKKILFGVSISVSLVGYLFFVYFAQMKFPKSLVFELFNLGMR